MIYSILYAVLAIFALGVLVFVHELGHYFMARREKMRVETFSIGFGKPIIFWKKQGVQWQVCCVPFGGYVKIAGMEKKGSKELHEIEDGFYSKTPWSRIKVLLAGPFVNIFLAFIIFSIIWMSGGREKYFSECTHLVGSIDAQSSLYKDGLRPGDKIDTYAGHPFTGFSQLMSMAILEKGSCIMTGEKINYFEDKQSPFSYTLDLGPSLMPLDKVNVLRNMLSPASYLIYDEKLGGVGDSPMEGSGIQSGDRVLWVDGELVFSRTQLTALINQPKVLLTVARGNSTFLTRIPRLQIGDLRISSDEKAEFQDIGYVLGMHGPVSSFYFIPYALSENCQVAGPLSYFDEMANEQNGFTPSGGSLEVALLPGDKIIAVDGEAVSELQTCFARLQKRKVQMVVIRSGNYAPVVSQEADDLFMKGVSFSDLQTLVQSIGTDSRLSNMGNLCLLKPIEPKPRYEFPLMQSIKDRLSNAVMTQKKQQKGEDTSKEDMIALKKLEETQNQVMLGLPLQDRRVYYNPSPFSLMTSSLVETGKMLYAMVTGYASPKYFAGPLGMVQVIHQGWADGVKEALFLVGAISFSLGVFNLLPIPVLDGGHICFALYEGITKKNIKAKTIEKMIFPFFFLFIAFFIYLTYQDLARLLGKFFS